MSVAARPETTPTVLVVDDVPMFRELERLFLSRIARVRTASELDEALREARVHAPEVILLDLNLPDATADAAAALLDAAGPDSALVMVTSGSREEHARALRLGAADVLAKPLSRAALLQSVSRFIGRPKRPAGLPRVVHACPVQIHRAGDAYTGTIRNISRGGLFIEADLPESAGRELSLAFDLPGTPERIESTAEVRWRRVNPNGGPSGMGVRFVDLDGPTSRSIDAFIHQSGAPTMPWLGAGA